ncbi:MAG: DUF4388 domain-containing protein [Pyrinomonadaceae bacterium]|nr:DUF4388 domain-containing protein [Pyrinomonadaceae bacterium]
MQHGRFLVLTGHLNDYPLSDLVGILRHQRKTGRLLIEYPNSPASFFFNEGELVDAQLDRLSGLQAVCVALAQPAASFNFNPLIRPTRRSIENSLQKVVSELLGCWGEEEVDVEKITPGEPLSRALLLPPSATLDVSERDMDTASMFLSLPPAPANRFGRPILGMAAAGLLLMGISTAIAVIGGFGKRVLSAAVSAPSHQTINNTLVREGSEALSQNRPRTDFPINSRVQRTVARGKDVTLDLEHSTRHASRTSSINKKEMKSSEELGVKSSTAKPNTRADEKTTEATAEIHSVKVVLHIEGGRVAQASIANHRSGMEAYEALALRIARQRRFPAKGATQEMVTIKVSPPN